MVSGHRRAQRTGWVKDRRRTLADGKLTKRGRVDTVQRNVPEQETATRASGPPREEESQNIPPIFGGPEARLTPTSWGQSGKGKATPSPRTPSDHEMEQTTRRAQGSRYRRARLGREHQERRQPGRGTELLLPRQLAARPRGKHQSVPARPGLGAWRPRRPPCTGRPAGWVGGARAA